MAPSKPNPREVKQAKARLRSYRARQAVHERSVKRRKRDNLIAGSALLVLLVLVSLVQIAYFAGGPGAAAPAPSASASASASPSSSPPAEDPASKAPDASAAPNPSAGPDEAPGNNTGDVPPKTRAQNRTWTGTMKLNDVELGIELDGQAAPQGVSSFVSLSESDFYQGLTCHRLTNDGFYILQCGDPKGNGTGGPGYSYGPIENAPAGDLYPAGTIAMARQGGDAYSMGSQFFIVYEDTTISSDAAGGYTVLGHITSGLDQLKSQITDAGIMENGTAPKVQTTITDVTLK